MKKNKKVPLGKKPFLVLSRRAIAGWLVVIFFVCGWMFGIGVLVGRGTSPLKIDVNVLQKKLQSARDKLLKKEQEASRRRSDSTKDKPELGFDEVLKRNEDEAAAFKVPSPVLIKPPVDPTPPKTVAKPKKKSKKRLTKTRKKITEPITAPDTEPAEISKPQPAAPAARVQTAGKPYTVQVASFKAARDADKLVAELKQKGFSAAYRAIGKVPGKGIWYRVRVGEFINQAEARKMLANLRKKGLKPVLVEK
ncbi:hypothetical protein D1AOALGA4SA_13077 [Olavius algarvensis Delta 1 endosymbiont]|nr:hypothetical protein D1AOALGA4SA_13077 [Olavius algarvensis Delta 1 endosymbiont]